MTIGRHRRSGPAQRGPAAVHVSMLLAAVATGASAAFAWTTMQPQSPVAPTASAVEDVSLVAVEPAAPPGPRPVRIAIPSIGVSADLEDLHRQSDGELSTPTEWADAGWYAEGVVPGRRGPAVIVGHLDSAADGPAVFYRLPLLRPGDEIFTDSSDGSRTRFVVDDAQRFAKTQFPTALVYGPTALPELRLITCTGPFDAAAHSYTDNLVVTAHAA